MLMNDEDFAAFNVEVKQRLVEVLRMAADGRIEELKSLPKFKARFGLCHLMKCTVINCIEALESRLKCSCPYNYDNLLTRRQHINYMQDVKSSVSFTKSRILVWLQAFKSYPSNVEGFAYFSGCQTYPVQSADLKVPYLFDFETQPFQSSDFKDPHAAYLYAEEYDAQYEGDYGRRRMALAAHWADILEAIKPNWGSNDFYFLPRND